MRHVLRTVERNDIQILRMKELTPSCCMLRISWPVVGVLKQLLHELQQIQNVTILFIKFNVKLYVSRFGVTIDGRVKLQCMYMYLPRITLIQLLFIRSGAQSPYGMAKTSCLFSQDVTIFNSIDGYSTSVFIYHQNHVEQTHVQ